MGVLVKINSRRAGYHPGMQVIELVEAVHGVEDRPRSERRSALTGLLPELKALLGATVVSNRWKAGLITRAHRAWDPECEKQNSPEAAYEALATSLRPEGPWLP